MIQPKLRYLQSPDVPDLKTHVPDDPTCFSILIQALIGPADGEGEESFDFTLTTPQFLDRRLMEGENAIRGGHHLIVAKYDYDQLLSFVTGHIQCSGGKNWAHVAQKLSRLGHWEFEDYRSNP